MDQTISLDTVVNFLVSTPFFDGLNGAERTEVSRIMEVQRLTDGEEVFHEGDPGNACYVIFEGRARVVKELEGKSVEFAVLEQGACFGEMALLDGGARSATVQAVGRLTVFRFRPIRFQQLLEQGSLGAYKLVLSMARTLSERHRQLTQEIFEQKARSQQPEGGEAIAQYRISE